MELTVFFSKEEEASYWSFVNDYLNSEEKKCLRNKRNLYFSTTLGYIKELQHILKSKKITLYQHNFDRRAIKYVDFLESFRLVKYQYSKYSNLKKSFTEGVYSAIVLEILKQLLGRFDEDIEIMDAGCGPSRVAFELSSFLPKAHFDLYDFSIINLMMAEKLLKDNQELKVPYRILSNPPFEVLKSDIDLLKIKGKNNPRINLNLIDLSNNIDAISKKYDLIVAVHSLNLLKRPDQAIIKLCNKLNDILPK